LGDDTGLEMASMEPRAIIDISQGLYGWFEKFTLVIEGKFKFL